MGLSENLQAKGGSGALLSTYSWPVAWPESGLKGAGRAGSGACYLRALEDKKADGRSGSGACEAL